MTLLVIFSCSFDSCFVMIFLLSICFSIQFIFFKILSHILIAIKNKFQCDSIILIQNNFKWLKSKEKRIDLYCKKKIKKIRRKTLSILRGKILRELTIIKNKTFLSIQSHITIQKAMAYTIYLNGFVIINRV